MDEKTPQANIFSGRMEPPSYTGQIDGWNFSFPFETPSSTEIGLIQLFLFEDGDVGIGVATLTNGTRWDPYFSTRIPNDQVLRHDFLTKLTEYLNWADFHPEQVEKARNEIKTKRIFNENGELKQ